MGVCATWLRRGRYSGRPADRKDESVGKALRILSGRHPDWGFWKLHHRLRKNGLFINHKRSWRVYRAMGSHLLKRVKKWLPARIKQPLVVAEAVNGRCPPTGHPI